MGTEDDLLDGVFEDVESDPLWVRAGLLVSAPPRPISKRHGVWSLAWLARVLPVVLTKNHLVVALLLYSKCLRQHGQTTVTLSNAELKPFGISRYAKYRTLAWLRQVGMIAIEETDHGRSGRVTLLWFP
jgi:hypothetical protein